MSINLKQNQDASAGLQGSDLDDGPVIFLHFQYVATSPASSAIFVAPRRLILKSINFRPDVAGTDTGAVTASVYSATSATAIGSGTLLHTGTANIKGAANTNQALTLASAATTLDIAAGTAIGVVFTGVMTSAQGAITVAFCPA
jgi:hypothetical protein